jgi:hypothetical protein
MLDRCKLMLAIIAIHTKITKTKVAKWGTPKIKQKKFNFGKTLDILSN